MDETLLHHLQAARDLAEKAAVLAESILITLPEPLALLARRCVVLHWFDQTIAEALMARSSLSQDELDNLYQLLLTLPFIETLPWGNAVQPLTREGLLRQYVKTQPELLKESALLAAPFYRARDPQDKRAAEALFCYMLGEERIPGRNLFVDLLDDASVRSDWQYVHEIFSLREEVRRLAFVPLFPLPDTYQLVKDLVYELQELNEYVEVFNVANVQSTHMLLEHANKGILQAFSGNLQKAQAHYNKALQLNGRLAPLLVSRGVVSLAREDYALALQDITRALHFDADNFFFLQQQGTALAGSEQFEEALAVYERMLALDPDFALAHREKGRVLLQLNRYTEALQAYERCLALDGYDAEAYMGKGTVLSRLSMYPEAQLAREKALSGPARI